MSSEIKQLRNEMENLRHRLSRTESKVTQIMLHFGIDPNKRVYLTPEQEKEADYRDHPPKA